MFVLVFICGRGGFPCWFRSSKASRNSSASRFLRQKQLNRNIFWFNWRSTWRLLITLIKDKFMQIKSCFVFISNQMPTNTHSEQVQPLGAGSLSDGPIRITWGQWLCLNWLQNRHTWVWKVCSVWHHEDTRTDRVRMGINAVVGSFVKTDLDKQPLLSAALTPPRHPLVALLK